MIYLKALIIVLLIALVFTVILLAVNSYFWLYEKAKSKALKNFLTYFYIFLGAAFIYLYVLFFYSIFAKSLQKMGLHRFLLRKKHS